VYFEKLYTPEDRKEYDECFNTHVQESLGEIAHDSYANDDKCMNYPIIHNEVSELCKSLKRKKAPGWDGITGEHIKHGGKYLVKFLTWPFNKITEHEYIPSPFKKGIIIPIPKGTKDRSCQDNYRGITIIPVIAKMYEKCIMNRLEKSRQVKDKIDKLQGVTADKCSSLHTAWFLKETISCKFEQGETVYLGLLDVKKAYRPRIRSGVPWILVGSMQLKNKWGLT
jgi:hypothetical protein